jgi:Flp pilus assembly protein TadG
VLDPRRNRARHDEGAAAVEFALVAVLLFSLIFGIIAFGFALFNQQGAVTAAREAARKAAVGVNSGNCQDVLRFGRNAVGTAKSSFTKMTLTTPSGNAYRQPVQVDVNYNVDLSLIGWIPGIPDTLSLTQTAKASLELGTAGFTSGCIIQGPSW